MARACLHALGPHALHVCAVHGCAGTRRHRVPGAHRGERRIVVHGGRGRVDRDKLGPRTWHEAHAKTLPANLRRNFEMGGMTLEAAFPRLLGGC